MRKEPSILAIDRGSKYVGLAHKQESNAVIFPLGYLMNDQMIFFHLADAMSRYNVKTIVLGWPSKQLDIQAKISKFMKNLDYIVDGKEVVIEKIEEDYTSVEAGDLVSQTFKDMEAFKKNAAEDTISAMKILERWIAAKKAT